MNEVKSLFYRESLLEKLHEIQNSYGYIPEIEIENLAEKYMLPRANVYGVISFYSMFYTEPTGKYIIRICDSISCHLNQSDSVLNAVKSFLNLESHQTTEDKKFTLEIVECLGHCGEGPVMMVNNKIYKKVNKNTALEILNNCL
ncbi:MULTISPECIES: NADH-quinone oxidoreductase subunit NuoE [Halanaerobium]|uniref:NADH-quinone oxidoreductase subunit E n=1 Tax=Halanaerobium kushneri TaxID=56779 RepID=A0A1N6Y5H6_9FIRM|nr:MULTISPECIES: NADH-quinone oxidoreductase subunit NuoE [Halanaerobium]RCW52470.1 NADH-quinone oxidoreductase subunit E [Halanaerobium sp. ST460_2HS_T2]SIR09804.1 NADH-quinone oxidoreductase subunit E [Halanaerobium kushneri]